MPFFLPHHIQGIAMKHIITLLFFATITFQLRAQSPLTNADKEFGALSYTKAAGLYEKVLKDDQEMREGQKLSIQAKLGYCYRQLKDTQKTEFMMREMISGYGKDLPEDYVNCYLFFAQALASNGKYKEAQQTYDKYSSFDSEDARSPSFSKLYNNVALLTKNAGSYKVEYLDMNSSDADFSPVYYKEGIVFVSGRNEGLGIKRVFSWDNTAFLDLYFLPELDNIKGEGLSSLGSSITTKSPAKRRWKSILGMDSYTATTANDSHTVGFFSGSSYNPSMGYGERPMTDSDRFSKTLNSKYHEGPATFNNAGDRVVFTRNNFNNGKYKVSEEGINKLKLYSAELVNGSWSKIEELPFNSDEFSTGHPAFNPDNTYLYFASDRPGGFGGTDIYISRWEDDSWSEPRNMGPEINTKGNELFPYVDPKGNLYFSSDGHPGMGDLDIFFAPMVNALKAKKSINLGAPINSNKDDFGLITDGERQLGLFSSNRKEGGKDDDIYRFRREGPMYACRDLTLVLYDAATNLPLSNVTVQLENKTMSDDVRQLKTDTTGNLLLCIAAENDFVLTASHVGYKNNSIGFAASAFEDDHPSMIEIPMVKGVDIARNLNSFNVKGNVLSTKENTPLAGVKVKVTDDTFGEVQDVLSGDDGGYSFLAISGHNYTIDAEHKKYGTFGKKIIGFDETKPTDYTIRMFEKGDLVKIDNIYYDLNRSDIRPDAAYELIKLIDLLEKYPNMRIELGSHTDSRSSANYNKILSDSRAKAAEEYLISKGIPVKRITSRGYGESRLINDCADGSDCSEEQHQQNRRTEIKIMNLD
jgi:outer membrane protein OmpA-like peptidoglycan-associated protein